MTLIELLVVIAIFSMILGLTLGATFSLKAHGANVYCITALKEIGSALRQYRIDHGAYPPPSRIEQYASAAHDGAPLAYYAQPPGVDLTLLKYGGAVQSLVDRRLLNRGAICRNDLAKTQTLPTGYSTYSLSYNYWGYDSEGNPYGQSWTGNDADGNPIFDTTAPLESRGDPLPAGIPTWEGYPRLANPDAPDTTIVTRCPYHRQGAKHRSVVLRLAGNVITVWDDEWLASDGVGISYQYQPERPGSP